MNADDINGEVERTAAILRRLACVHVQGLPPESIRPFAESSRQDGWRAVAREVMRAVWHMAKPGSNAIEHMRLFNGKDGMPEWDSTDDEMEGFERFLVNVGRIEVALNISPLTSPFS